MAACGKKVSPEEHNKQTPFLLLPCFVITVLLSGLQPTAFSLHKSRRKGEKYMWSGVRLEVLKRSGSQKFFCMLFFQCLSLPMLLSTCRGKVYWSMCAAVWGLRERDLCSVGETLAILFEVNITM